MAGWIGECPECEERLSTLWVIPPPHTDEFHDQVRRRLLGSARILFKEKAAGKLGHKVTIRFTQDHAWPECACGWRGYTWQSSASARYQGHCHLYGVWHKAGLDSDPMVDELPYL